MIARRQVVGGAAGALGLLLAPRLRAAEPPKPGTVPKTDLSYRDHPLGDKSCATCAHFLRATASGGEDHCTVVAGAVRPEAYCIAWLDANPANSC